jgi:hypothetical protein
VIFSKILSQNGTINSEYLQSWNRHYKTRVNLKPVDSSTKLKSIVMGAGKSYGDCFLNSSGVTLVDSSTNNIQLNSSKEITVSGNTRIIDLLNFLLPHELTLNILPGTKLVTIGGCIANDVHGKNHFKVGSFYNQVISFILRNPSNGTELYCSRYSNKELFNASFGACGLTGWISEVKLRVVPLNSKLLIETSKHDTFEDTMKFMQENRSKADYMIAIQRHNKNNLSYIVYLASKIVNSESINFKLNEPSGFLPFTFPFINRFSFYLRNVSLKLGSIAKPTSKIWSVYDFIFMADKFKNVNKWFGKNGFVEYQFVLSEDKFSSAREIIEYVNLRTTIYLGGIKLFGKGNNSPMSFPKQGATFTLLIKPSHKNLQILRHLDGEILNANGRIYLAKDSSLSSTIFHKMYPKAKNISIIRKNYNLLNFSSDLSKRLKIE